MAPKNKFGKQAIFNFAFEHVRKKGWEGLSARYIADKLGCSTMPIYSSFQSMRHLEEEIIRKGLSLQMRYVRTKTIGDSWVDQGIGYVMFAVEERHLFRALKDEKHIKTIRPLRQTLWRTLDDELQNYPMFEGLATEWVEMARRVRLFFVHGLADVITAGATPKIDKKEMIWSIQETSYAILNGFKTASEKGPKMPDGLYWMLKEKRFK